MTAHEFFLDPAKEAVRAAVASGESQTAAEIVVAVRRESGHYRHADMTVGIGFAFVLLCVFLYYPEPFNFTFLPLELAAAFAVGFGLCAYVAPLRRLLITQALRRESVRRAACEVFVASNVSRTRTRTGVLVYASLFEQQVEIVLDVGIDPKAIGPLWDDLLWKFDRAIRVDAEVRRFAAAVGELGGLLATAYPGRAGDENELPDALDTGEASPSGPEDSEVTQ